MSTSGHETMDSLVESVFVVWFRLLRRRSLGVLLVLAACVFLFGWWWWLCGLY